MKRSTLEARLCSRCFNPTGGQTAVLTFNSRVYTNIYKQANTFFILVKQLLLKSQKILSKKN
jgi:hypothetical protein